jgi:hypothetical protein
VWIELAHLAEHFARMLVLAELPKHFAQVYASRDPYTVRVLIETWDDTAVQ